MIESISEIEEENFTYIECTLKQLLPWVDIALNNNIDELTQYMDLLTKVWEEIKRKLDLSICFVHKTFSMLNDRKMVKKWVCKSVTKITIICKDCFIR